MLEPVGAVEEGEGEGVWDVIPLLTCGGGVYSWCSTWGLLGGYSCGLATHLSWILLTIGG